MTDQPAVVLTAVVQTVSALSRLTAPDSADRTSLAPLSQTALIARTVLKDPSVLLVLAVNETYVWDHARLKHGDHCSLAVISLKCTQAERGMLESWKSHNNSFRDTSFKALVALAYDLDT